MNWDMTTLGEVAEVTVGFVGSMRKHFVSDGIPFLRSKNVRPHRIDVLDLEYIDEAFHKKISKSRLAPGDVVTVRTGAPGSSCVIPDWLPEANCSDLVITRPGPHLDARWLSYYFNSTAKNYINGHLVGAVQQHFNVGAAASMSLLLPPLSEQVAIAEVLGALDEKIATNSRLESMNQALISAMFGQAVELGCRESSLLDEVGVTFGEPFKGDNFSPTGIGRPLLRIRDISKRYCDVWTTETRPRETVIQAGDVLVGMDAEFRPQYWLGEPSLLNQRVCCVSSRSLGPAFTLNLLEPALRRIESAKSGTTVIHLNKADLARESLMVPYGSRALTLSGAADDLLQRLVSAAEESRTLARLRDALLPALMDGRLRVRDAIATVEDIL